MMQSVIHSLSTTSWLLKACDILRDDSDNICTVTTQAVRKLHGHLKSLREAAVERDLPQAKPINLTPHEQTLDEDLDEAAQVGGCTLCHVCAQHDNIWIELAQIVP